MTKRENKTESKSVKNTSKEKKVLYEAVQEHPQPNFVIMGALSIAGLLDKYKDEEQSYGRFNIEPSITDDELDKIIKKFIGE